MQLSDMIKGKQYLVGDGCGYDIVTCMGVPTQKEIEDFFGDNAAGSYMRVSYEEGRDDIFMETEGCRLYIEPR